MISYICRIICFEPGESCNCVYALLNTVKKRHVCYRRLGCEDRGLIQKISLGKRDTFRKLTETLNTFILHWI
jgi:hypothetical protein